jgi:ectoine hydroxylase-related dioxygenase (phytanoyl-CoA dioxygenase family)
MTQTLDEAGCVVIHDVQSAEAVDRVKRELAEPLAALNIPTEDSPADFYPANTRRLPALLARSPATHSMALDPTVQDLCQHHLGDNCERYQLHVSAALEIGPGAREQILHREEDPFDFFAVPRPNLVIATMWAISDFRKSNGATLIVPGSHRWSGERTAQPEEVLHAEMPKGSVLVWLGGTLHAAGANTSDEWRYGIFLSYSLGWLRQEENQYLDLPPSLVNSMSNEIKELVGYPMHGSLGFYDPGISV